MFTKIKLTIISTILTFAVVTSNAQDRKFIFGFTGSGAVSWLKPDNPNMSRDGLKIGYSYGIMGDYMFGENYAFSSGAMITNNGGKMKFLHDTLSYLIKPNDTTSYYAMYDISTTRTYSITDIEIPLLFKMKTNEIGYLKYFGQIGFSAGFRYKVKGTVDYDKKEVEKNIGTNVETRYENIDYSNEISFFRAALQIGAGIEYNLSGNTSLVCAVNFKNGINNSYKTKYKPSGSNSKVENRTFNGSADEYTVDSKLNQSVNFNGPVKNAITNQIVLTVGIIF